jgi:hypothetical protein
MFHTLSRTLLLGALVTGCAPSYLPPETTPRAPEGTLPPDFTESAREVNVPTEILFAIAKVETGFQMVVGEAEFEGQEPAFGLLALRGEKLRLGAELAGLTVEEVKSDRYANLSAAAHLLAYYAEEEGVAADAPLGEWAPVVARYASLPTDDTEALAEYIHHEVYRSLRAGIEIEGFSMPPTEVDASWPLPQRDLDRARDANTVWTPSPNYNSRSGSSVEFVIIHTCEGSYSSCWSWLTNRSSGVSAHYVVNDSGSEVRSLVDESNRAWHVSASYDCDLNGRVECSREGASLNTLSVGIEHAGYGSQSSWSTGLLQRSAELTCGITQRHGVPRDSYHIVGHGRLQPWNRSDPGPNWPWTDYLNRVKVACGDLSGGGGGTGGGGGGGGTTPPPAGAQFVIDSNNAANDTANHYLEISSAWRTSASVSTYYNTGYWYAPTDEVSDPARFHFQIPADACYTVEAWWPAASDRPTNAAFIGYGASDQEVGRAWVNQTVNGGRWNRLGAWRFDAGWNQVALSRWTTAGTYAVADAVRLTPTTCP